MPWDSHRQLGKDPKAGKKTAKSRTLFIRQLSAAEDLWGTTRQLDYNFFILCHQLIAFQRDIHTHTHRVPKAQHLSLRPSWLYFSHYTKLQVCTQQPHSLIILLAGWREAPGVVSCVLAKTNLVQWPWPFPTALRAPGHSPQRQSFITKGRAKY